MTLLNKYAIELRGLFGSIVTIVLPTLHQMETWLRFLGAAGGAILVCLSIGEKIINMRKARKDEDISKRN